MPEDILLDVRGLETRFKTPEGPVHAVNGVSFGLKKGETIGLVGESGSGKSVTMLSVLRLLPSPPAEVTAGSALFHGKDLLAMSDREIRGARGGQISIVFQDPMTSFNAVLTIGRQITEPLEVHLGMSPPARGCAPRSCSAWWASPAPRTVSATTPTSSPAGCASAP